MYHLVRSLYLQYTSKPEYSILLLGLENAGKTTLLNQIKAIFNTTANTSTSSTSDPLAASLLSSSSSASAPSNGGAEAQQIPGASPSAGNTVPTVGQNVATIDLPEMYLKMWDIGGQMSLRRLWMGYYRVCHAVVFVVDSSDLGSGGDDYGGEYGFWGDVGEGGNKDGSRGKGMVGGGGGPDDEYPAGTGRTQTQRPVAAGGGGGSGSVRGWQAGGGRMKSFRRGSSAVFDTPTATTSTEPGDAGGGGLEPGSAIDGPSWAAAWPKTPTTPITPSALSGRHQGRLEEARQVLESVLGHEDMGGVPILVLANKQDREDSLEVVRIKEGFVRKVFEGEKGGLVRDSRVLPVSALKGTGVREAVEWVKSRVVWNKEGRPPVMR